MSGLPAGAAQETRGRVAAGRRLDVNVASLGLLGVLVLLVAAFSILSPYFLSVENFLNIGRSVAIVGIAAVGMTIILISGGLDLSVASVMAASAMLAATLINQGWGFWPAIVAGLVLSVLVGLLNGVIIAVARINPIITTLGTMGIIRGIAFISSGGATIIPTVPEWRIFGREYLAGVPVPLLLMLLTYALGFVALNYTRFGRYVYAIGGNPIAVRLAGVNVDGWRIVMYAVTGLLSGFAGIVLGSLSGSAFPNAALGMELDIIAAVILGGTSLAGGMGTVQGTFLGVLIIGIVKNGLIQLNVPTYWQMVAQGAVLLVAVLADRWRTGGYR